jgi:hypothetical protein
MSEGYLLLVIQLSQSLVVRPEAVVVLEELPEELYWQDWMQRLLWMGPEVKFQNGSPIVLELRNCVFFSSQESVDVRSFECHPQLFLRRC